MIQKPEEFLDANCPPCVECSDYICGDCFKDMECGKPLVWRNVIRREKVIIQWRSENQ